MTAVPVRRNRTKDTFQHELDKEIAKRKSAGLATGFSSDEQNYEDDFEDDFEEEEKPVSQKTSKFSATNNRKKHSQANTWKMPSYLESDDDSSDDGTRFLKTSSHTSFDRATTVKSPKSIKRQSAIGEAKHDDNPLLSLLSEHGIKPKNSPGDSFTPDPVRSASPSITKSNSALYHNKLHSGNSLNHLVSPNEFQGKKEVDSIGSFRNADKMFTKNSSEYNSPDFSRSKQSSTKTSANIDKQTKSNKGYEKNDSRSIIDYLLEEDKPKEPIPAPRKKETKERERSRSNSGSRPGSAKSKREKSPSLQFSSTQKDNGSLLGSLPALSVSNCTQKTINGNNISHDDVGRLTPDQMTNLKKGSQLENTTSDDLLALFEQANIEPVPTNQQVKPISEDQNIKSPVEEVVEKTNQQQHSNDPKQRSSKLLSDNVIENVALHNQENEFYKDMNDITKESKTPSVKHKRQKTHLPKPSKDYHGLGSLTALKQLQSNSTNTEQNDNLNSTTDIRNAVYLSWLNEREKQRKIKTKNQKLQLKEKEEKKQQELKESKLENESARDAWEKQKEVIIKENLKNKRKSERKEREEKLRKEEEKWKSQRKCDVVRKKALEEAKEKHKQELKKKREDEQIEKEKEKLKKQESKKAVDEWMDKRSKQWVKDKKEKEREKRKKERELKEEKKMESDEAQEKYQKWRERKEDQLRESRTDLNYSQLDDRPVWSPANKIIPRRR